MRSLYLSIYISTWPWHPWSAGHAFDGETHEWWLGLGPVGFLLSFEPLSAE